MSNVAFDFLSESFLFHEDDGNYSHRSLNEVDSEIQKYKAYIDSNKRAISEEVQKENLNYVSYSQDYNIPSIDEILRGSLFLDTFIINDPLYSMYITRSAMEDIHRQCSGMPIETDEDKKRKVAESIRYMKNLTEGVRCDTGYIKFFPFDFSARCKNLNEIIMPDLDISSISNDVYKWLNDRLQNYNLNAKGSRINEQGLSNTVLLDFDKDNRKRKRIVRYFQIEPLAIEGNQCTLKINPNYVPSKFEFDNWVEQERIKTIKEELEFLANRDYMCSVFAAPVVLNSLFEKDFYEMNFAGNAGNDNLYKMGFDLNFLGMKNISLEKVMEVRRRSKDSFKSFQSKLKKASELISLASDRKEYNAYLETYKRTCIDSIKSTKGILDNIKSLVSSNITDLGITFFSYLCTPAPFNNIITGLNVLKIMSAGVNSMKTTQRNPFYFLRKLS